MATEFVRPVTIAPGANHVAVEEFWGFTVKEDASAAAEWVFRIVGATDTIVWYLQLSADQSASIMFPKGIRTPGGVYVEEVTGSATGVLFTNA